MPKLPPPPVIEGTLKEPICALTSGVLVAWLCINVCSLLTPNYFAYVVGAVFALECLLWSIDKPRKDYEVYKPPTASKKNSKSENKTKQGGTKSDSEEKQTVESGKKKERVNDTENAKAKYDKTGKESRFKFRNKKNLDAPDAS